MKLVKDTDWIKKSNFKPDVLCEVHIDSSDCTICHYSANIVFCDIFDGEWRMRNFNLLLFTLLVKNMVITSQDF